MIEKISHYFSKQLAANTEEEEILQYGFECLINTFIPVIFFLVFAIVQNMITETMIWLILFLLLRNYIGGYHASSHVRCIVISTIYGLTALFCIYYFKSIPLIAEICICLLIIILYIPLQMNHLHGLYEPASRRMRTTLTETAPTYYFVSFQVYT